MAVKMFHSLFANKGWSTRFFFGYIFDPYNWMITNDDFIEVTLFADNISIL